MTTKTRPTHTPSSSTYKGEGEEGAQFQGKWDEEANTSKQSHPRCRTLTHCGATLVVQRLCEKRRCA